MNSHPLCFHSSVFLRLFDLWDLFRAVQSCGEKKKLCGSTELWERSYGNKEKCENKELWEHRTVQTKNCVETQTCTNKEGCANKGLWKHRAIETKNCVGTQT